MNIAICTIKSWNIENANILKNQYESEHNISIITHKDELNLDLLNNLKPDYIFFPHWSYIIPEDIFLKFNCVVFHMTDLPFGRGGSPLQNLISRGIYKTKVSAIKVVKEIDAGPIYIKKDLDISNGCAEEIFKKASKIVFKEMIPYIIKNSCKPLPQVGEPVEFKRRNSSESEIKDNFSLRKIYDYIRMLDAEGYPKAFIDFGEYRLYFSDAEISENDVIAKVEIKKKGEEQT